MIGLISENSQWLDLSVFFIKVFFIKNETGAQICSCQFCKFLRTSLLQNTYERLFLCIRNCFLFILHSQNWTHAKKNISKNLLLFWELTFTWIVLNSYIHSNLLTLVQSSDEDSRKAPMEIVLDILLWNLNKIVYFMFYIRQVKLKANLKCFCLYFSGGYS